MQDDTTALVPFISMADAGDMADAWAKAHTLETYQNKTRQQTLDRQASDILVFTRYLHSIGVQVPDDMATHLQGWRYVTSGLLETFLNWQQKQGYAIGTINVRLSTVRLYCGLAHAAGVLDSDAHLHIRGVKGITEKHGKTIDSKRAITRIGTKKASAVIIPDDALPLLKHPATGLLADRDALLMCLLLDHGLRVGEVALLQRASIHLVTRRLLFARPKVSIGKQTDALTDDTHAAAARYLATLAPLARGEDAASTSLFDLAIISIQKRVGLIGELAGLHGLSPHDCRHDWATRAAAHGTPLERLRQAGGWRTLAMPDHYIRDSDIANEGVKLS